MTVRSSSAGDWLSEDYMKTLEVGEYTIKFVLDDGRECETTQSRIAGLFTHQQSESVSRRI